MYRFQIYRDLSKYAGRNCIQITCPNKVSAVNVKVQKALVLTLTEVVTCPRYLNCISAD